MTDDLDEVTPGEVCSLCRTSGGERPRLVAGVFTDVAGAKEVAERLRAGTIGEVNVLTGVAGSQEGWDAAAAPSLGCSRLHKQIVRHLISGAAVVVVDARSPEQQLGASRALLESKCDLLLTHDGSRRFE